MKKLVELPRDKWPTQNDPRMKAVYGNDRYMVIVQHCDHPFIAAHLKIRCIHKVNSMWYDRVPWDDMQDLKNQAGFEGLDAVEIFPREEDRLDTQMRHLWVLYNAIDFAWRAAMAKETKRAEPEPELVLGPVSPEFLKKYAKPATPDNVTEFPAKETDQ